MDVQGKIVGGVGNLAQAVEIKLTEKGERNEKKEQVLETLYNGTHEIMRELGQNREETLKSQKELVPMGRKLKALAGNVIVEVVKSANSLVQNYTESEIRNDSMDKEKLPKMPYFLDAKVEYAG